MIITALLMEKLSSFLVVLIPHWWHKHICWILPVLLTLTCAHTCPPSPAPPVTAPPSPAGAPRSCAWPFGRKGRAGQGGTGQGQAGQGRAAEQATVSKCIVRERGTACGEEINRCNDDTGVCAPVRKCVYLCTHVFACVHACMHACWCVLLTAIQAGLPASRPRLFASDS